MALQFNCQHCNELVFVFQAAGGEIAECKKCGEKNIIPENAEGISESEIKSEHTISDAFDDGNNKQSDSKTIEVSTHKGNSTQFQPVTIEDIKMPFGSMVQFMVKWAIASIPAFIILFLIGMMVMGVFGVGIATLFK